MRKVLLLITALSIFSLREILGKPAQIATSLDTLDPVALNANNSSEEDAKREHRSPQYGLLGDYNDYSDYGQSRHFHFGHKRKFHKPHGIFGGHGCRGFSCGGYDGHHDGHHHGHHHGEGGSFATASAGSISGGGGPYNGGYNQANAQSASFNFGPYSATFSAAHSSSGRGGF